MSNINDPNKELDECQVCLGASGGVRGNENVTPYGVVVCDYCSFKLTDLKHTVLFCGESKSHKGGTYLNNFSPSTMQVRMFGFTRFFRVLVSEDRSRDLQTKEGYWAWWNTDVRTSQAMNQFSMVYANRMLLDMCFPYGPEAEEARGKGIRIPVKIDVIEEVAG